jgi:hypothetical protein
MAVKKTKKVVKKTAPVAERKVNNRDPLDSPVIRIGVVFVVIAALALMFYAGQISTVMMQK